MYYSTDAITGFRATATDGELGKVLGFGFDDQTWEVSCVIVRAGWFPGHVVMVDSKSVKMVDGAKKRIFFDLTKEGLRNQAAIDSNPPVHKLEERLQSGRSDASPSQAQVESTHLRNTSVVIGYRAEATDGGVGKVCDIIVDTKAWRVHELVVREGRLFGTLRALAPQWAIAIDWATKQVKLLVDKEAVRSSPVFDPKAPVNTTRETRVVDYNAETHLAKREEVAGSSTR
ncbi:MAG: sporulation protein YlmC with PRC-barrel domain [Planctomycetota bacterium]|jgi:sporulation protein YlmC with PRC-barrel domain